MTTSYAGASKVVAVAGSKGGAGQHVTEALLSAGFSVVILLRKDNTDLVKELTPFLPSGAKPEALSAEVVDFTNKDQLTTVFKKHYVDTVISALVLIGPDEWKVEQNLLNAAIDAGARRFAPSNWAGPVEESHAMRAYEFKRIVMGLIKDAPISWTHFTTGIFMNYFGSNAPAQDGKSPVGHLQPLKFGIDVENGTAQIPGSGDAGPGFTEIHDVGRGAAAACALEAAWEPKTGWMVGDSSSYNEALKIAEEVRGKKFNVQHLSDEALAEECKKGEGKPVMETFYHEAMKMIADTKAKDLNHLSEALRKEGKEGLFKPISVKEYIEKWWKGVA